MKSLDAADRPFRIRPLEETTDRSFDGVDVSGILFELPETGQKGVTRTDALYATQEALRWEIAEDAIHLVALRVEENQRRITVDLEAIGQLRTLLLGIHLH